MRCRTLHAKLDVDGDGELTQKDCALMADRWVSIAHASPREAEKLHDLFNKVMHSVRAKGAGRGIPPLKMKIPPELGRKGGPSPPKPPPLLLVSEGVKFG